MIRFKKPRLILPSSGGLLLVLMMSLVVVAASSGCAGSDPSKGEDPDPGVNDFSADAFSKQASFRGAIKLNVALSGTFDESSYHLYDLTVVKPVTVSIDLRGVNGFNLDTVLRVYGPRDSAGNLPERKIAYDDDSGEGYASLISVLDLNSGTYAVLAATYGGRARPGRSYELLVTCTSGNCESSGEDGEECLLPSDCRSGVCSADVCQAPTCGDVVRNGDETDVDCGGSCAACLDDMRCLVPADCQSGVCSSGVCQAPRCDDGVQNGDETGVDSGGSCAREGVVITVFKDPAASFSMSDEVLEGYALGAMQEIAAAVAEVDDGHTFNYRIDGVYPHSDWSHESCGLAFPDSTIYHGLYFTSQALFQEGFASSEYAAVDVDHLLTCDLSQKWYSSPEIAVLHELSHIFGAGHCTNSEPCSLDRQDMQNLKYYGLCSEHRASIREFIISNGF